MKQFTLISTTMVLSLFTSESIQLTWAQASEIHSNIGNWQEVKVKGAVTVSRRTYTLDEVESRETKASAYMDQSLESIFQVLSGNSHIWATLKRMQGTRDFNVASDKSFWNSYVVIDMPWPLKDQDLVIQSQFVSGNKGSTRVIEVEGVPGLIPEKDGLGRIQYYKCIWSLEAIDKNTTLVEYISTSKGKPKFPRWITDPIVYKSLITLLENLREMTEETLAYQAKN